MSRRVIAMFLGVSCVMLTAVIAAEKPSGNVQQDIQKLFDIIAKQQAIIEAQADRIRTLEQDLGTTEQRTVEALQKVVREEVAPDVSTAAGIHEREKSGLFGSVGASYLRLGGLTDVDYAVWEHPLDSEGNYGRMESIDASWDPAYRGAIGYRYDNGDEITLTYWGGEFEHSGTVTDPSGNDDLQTVLLHAETDDAEDIDYAHAEVGVDLHRLGLAYVHPFYQNGPIRLSCGAALTYMRMSQSLSVIYKDDAVVEAFLDSNVENDLFGPGAILRGEYAVTDCISLTASCGASLMYIKSSIDQIEGDVNTIDAPVDICDEREGVTPLIEMAFGLIWRPVERLKIGVGYEMMWIPDVYTLHQGIDDTSEGQSISWDENLTLHGAAIDAIWTF